MRRTTRRRCIYSKDTPLVIAVERTTISLKPREMCTFSLSRSFLCCSLSPLWPYLSVYFLLFSSPSFSLFHNPLFLPRLRFVAVVTSLCAALLFSFTFLFPPFLSPPQGISPADCTPIKVRNSCSSLYLSLVFISFFHLSACISISPPSLSPFPPSPSLSILSIIPTTLYRFSSGCVAVLPHLCVLYFLFYLRSVHSACSLFFSSTLCLFSVSLALDAVAVVVFYLPPPFSFSSYRICCALFLILLPMGRVVTDFFLSPSSSLAVFLFPLFLSFVGCLGLCSM